MKKQKALISPITAAALPSPEHHLLRRNRPRGFSVKQLVYRQLYHDQTGWHYSVIDMPMTIDSSFDIDSHAAWEARNTHPAYDQDVPEDSRLGIKISKHSYIIIELDPRLNYKFNPDIESAGIDLGRYSNNHPFPASLYGRLRHVDTSGNVSIAPLANCRLAFFAAVNAGSHTNHFSQSLNFNLIDQGGTVIAVDPDIRYPGNGAS